MIGRACSVTTTATPHRSSGAPVGRNGWSGGELCSGAPIAEPVTEHGLPIEVYVFSRDQVWSRYEAIQADIFDHLLAVVPEFDLRVFQSPSGRDVERAFGTWS